MFCLAVYIMQYITTIYYLLHVGENEPLVAPPLISEILDPLFQKDSQLTKTCPTAF